jgi:hypothetical protein
MKNAKMPMNTTATKPLKPTLLPPGQPPGFGKLKSQPGVFRCKLRPDSAKKRPEHSDYIGTLFLDEGRRTSARVWVHADSSLGLRLEILK